MNLLGEYLCYENIHSFMEGPVDDLIDNLRSSQSTLIVAPPEQRHDDQMCIGLLARDSPSNANILSITLSATPKDRLTVWQRQHGSELPARTTIINAREAATDEAETVDLDDSATAVDILSASPDPLDLALTVARQLGAWEETDTPTQVCFHSLSSLAVTLSADGIANFVSVLNDFCRRLDVSIHYHIDPEESEEILAMLRPLHDTVVTFSGDTWSVATRGDEESPSFRRSESPPGGSLTDRQELVPMPYSFDTMVDLINNPIRRSLLYYLKDRDAATIELEKLARVIHRRAEAIPARDPPTRDQLKRQLLHVHIPKLVAAGIVSFDRQVGSIEYTPNPAVVSFLRYLERCELG